MARETGFQIEKLALDYLQQRGLKLLASNYTSRHGEIDLVMKEHKVCVFVEVRFRRSSSFGGASASVTPAKQRKIAMTALAYLREKGKKELGSHEPDCRFDVLAASGTEGAAVFDWIQGAFDSPL